MSIHGDSGIRAHIYVYFFIFFIYYKKLNAYMSSDTKTHISFFILASELI